MSDELARSDSAPDISRPLLLGGAALLIATVAAVGVVVATMQVPAERTALLLALLGSGLFLVFAARYPTALVFAILLYETLLSWREVEQIALLGYNRLLFYAVTVGAFGLALFFAMLLRRRAVRLGFVDVALFLYVVAFGVTVVTARDPVAARSAFTYLLATISVFYTTRLVVRSRSQIAQVVNFLLVLMLLEAILGIFQFTTGRGVLYITSETGGAVFRRATGTLGNGLGWYLGVGFIVAFGLWYFGEHGRQSARTLVAVGAIGTGLLVANTRGAWVDAALAAGITIVIGLAPRRFPRRDRLFFLALLALGGLALVLFSSGLQERVVSIWDQIMDPGQSTVGFRFYVWEAALNMFRAAPWFGVGPDNYRLLLADYATPEAAAFLRLELGRTYSPHHAGLHVLAESGAVGAVAFGLFLLAFLREAGRGMRGPGRNSLGNALFVFALVSTLSILYGGYAFGGYTQVGRLYFILAGLTVVQARLPHSTHDEPA